MWVSRKEFERLRKRIDDMQADIVSCRNITVYAPEPSLRTHAVLYGWTLPHGTMSHGDAIRALAQKAGLEFKYEAGSPAKPPTAVLVKAKEK